MFSIDTIIVGLVIIGIGLFIAATRKGSSHLKTKPQRLLSFYTEINAKDVFKIIIKFAQLSGYKVESIDENNLCIVLGDSPNINSFGRFYPIYVTQDSQVGKTLVEVGIKNKVGLTLGLFVSSSHEECYNGIKAAVLADEK